MSIDFIFFGTIFILMTFGFFKCSDRSVFFVAIIFLGLIVVGYFVPNFNSEFLSLNTLHLLAVLLAFVFLNYKFNVNILSSMFVALFYYLLLTFNANFISVYNINWFSVFILFPCLPSILNLWVGCVKLINNIFFILVIDTLFEYYEFNYATMNFDIVFKIIVFYLLVSIICYVLNRYAFIKRRFAYYEKRDFIITFNNSCI